MGQTEPSSLAKLCSCCQQVIDSWFSLLGQGIRSHYEFDISHYASIYDLEQSARDRCGLCARFVASLSQQGIDILRSLQVQGAGDGRWKNRISVDDTGSGEWLLSSYFNPPVFDDRGFPVAPCAILVQADLVKQNAPEISTGATATLELIIRWVRICLAQHRECVAASAGIKRPTRLLELYDDGVRLRSSTDIESSPSYLTISHCWGTLDMLKLKKGTLKMLHQGIPVWKLCKTFQDAIHVAKELEIKYLWIDSMCIIQDDEEDWRRESVSMATIYGQATLCLAATGARNGSDGLFFDRETVKVQRQYLRMPNSGLWEILDSKLYRRCISKAPLSDRAWAFQERYLSIRTLHFTREQVFWECCRDLSCESYPDGLPVQTYGKNLKSLSRAPSISARNLWSKLILEYSSCRLTYSRDKLVAISGVAQAMAVSKLGRYLAGMWREELEEQLCWRVHSVNWTKTLSDPKSGLYRAPSWSWASVDFPVFLPHQSTMARFLTHVQATSVTLLGPNEYGEVKDAKLQLSCYPLLDAKHVLKRRGTTLFRTFHLTYEYGANEPHHSVWDDRSILSKADIYWDGKVDQDNLEKDVYLLPISTTRQGPSYLTSCLLVSPSKRDIVGCFARLGMCTLHLEIQIEELILAILRISQDSIADDSLYGAVSGVNEHGLMEYVLTLV